VLELSNYLQTCQHLLKPLVLMLLETTGNTTTTQTTGDETGDRDFDWGWLGLLGLAGLAG